jgi:hypothetical protein
VAWIPAAARRRAWAGRPGMAQCSPPAAAARRSIPPAHPGSRRRVLLAAGRTLSGRTYHARSRPGTRFLTLPSMLLPLLLSAGAKGGQLDKGVYPCARVRRWDTITTVAGGDWVGWGRKQPRGATLEVCLLRLSRGQGGAFRCGMREGGVRGIFGLFLS